MGAAPLSFVAAAAWALNGFFLPSRLCAAETIYAEKGSSVELTCSCPSCFGGRREVNWHFFQNGSTTTIFQKATDSSRVPVASGRLKMLQNYSLHVSNVTESDSGRYWCEQLYYDLVVVTGRAEAQELFDTCSFILRCEGQQIFLGSLLPEARGEIAEKYAQNNSSFKHFCSWIPDFCPHAKNYEPNLGLFSLIFCPLVDFFAQNQEMFLALPGMKRMMESGRADVACYVLSCSVSGKELVWDVASWWEGKKKLKEEDEKGGFSIFRGKWASQFHICLTKEVFSDQEGRRTRERRVKCRFAERMEITFSLTGTVKDCSPVSHNHTLGLQSKGSSTSWIFLGVFDALLLVVIFVLGVALWRSHKHQEHLKEGDKGASESESMMYENVQTGSEKPRHRKDPALH